MCNEDAAVDQVAMREAVKDIIDMAFKRADQLDGPYTSKFAVMFVAGGQLAARGLALPQADANLEQQCLDLIEAVMTTRKVLMEGVANDLTRRV